MTDRLLIAAESSPDAALVRDLGDRVLSGAVEWTRDNLDACRAWAGIDGQDYVDLHRIKVLAKAKKVKAHGRFGDEAGQPDSVMARKLFLLADLESPKPSMVVVVRDADNQADRRLGFEQAAKDRDWPFKAVLALATPEIEAWLLAGLFGDARYQHEATKCRSELGFDPLQRPEKLSSTSGNQRDTKSVLDRIEPNRDVARSLLVECPLEALRSLRDCGLGPFIEDFEVACRHVFEARRHDSIA